MVDGIADEISTRSVCGIDCRRAWGTLRLDGGPVQGRSSIATFAGPTATRAYGWAVDKTTGALAFAKPTVSSIRSSIATFAGPTADWAIDKSRGWFAFAKPTAAGNSGEPESNPPAVRVVAAPVVEATVPILLSGIGTVIPYNTVDTKAQVDGVIMRLNFVEGDDVKIGDPLATIDTQPRMRRASRSGKRRSSGRLLSSKTQK